MGASQSNLSSSEMGNGDSTVDVPVDFFPFGDLPKEIALYIFKHHLDAADRLKARVCSGIYKLEAGETFNMGRLLIVDDPSYKEDDDAESGGCCCKCRKRVESVTMLVKPSKPAEVYVDGIQKLTSNSTFSSVLFKMSGSVSADLLNAVARIDALFLTVEIEDDTSTVLLTDEKVMELSRGRRSLSFSHFFPSVSAELISRFFQGMESVADPLRQVSFFGVTRNIVVETLVTIGVILCEDDHFHSNDPNIEVFLSTDYIFFLMGDRLIFVDTVILTKNETGVIVINRYDEDGSVPRGVLMFEKENLREVLYKIPLVPLSAD